MRGLGYAPWFVLCLTASATADDGGAQGLGKGEADAAAAARASARGDAGTAQATSAVGDAGVTPGPREPTVAPIPKDHEPRIYRSLEPSAGLHTGDAFTLRIRAEAAEGDDVTVPDPTLGPFEVLDKKARVEPEKEGRRPFVFELVLLALEPGDHEIPPIVLRVVTADGVIGQTHTPPTEVHVASLLGNEPNAKPKPQTKPVRVMEDDFTLLYLAGGFLAVLLIALATLLLARWWRRRPRPAPPPPPPRPPWDVALERFAELRRGLPGAVAEGGVVGWVDSLSDAVRDYLGARYGFDGLESTTDEALAHLRSHSLTGTSVPEVSALLGECDLVKFAKATVDEDRATALLDEAAGLVTRTRPAPRPVAGPPDGGPAPTAAPDAGAAPRPPREAPP